MHVLSHVLKDAIIRYVKTAWTRVHSDRTSRAYRVDQNAPFSYAL